MRGSTSASTAGPFGPATSCYLRVLVLTVALVSAFMVVGAAAAVAAGPPVVESQSASPAVIEAELKATINPGNESTSYRFEYGTSVSYGQSTATMLLAAGEAGVPVVVHVVGLSPGTTYHFRAVATNPTETVHGADQAFSTQGLEPGHCPNEALRIGPSAALSECRAYEMVSPPDKNGGNVSQKGADQSNSSGDGISFFSSAAFAGAEGSPQGVPYLSRRGATNWTTVGLEIPQYTAAGLLSLPTKNSSENLAKTLQASRMALAPGAIAGGSNLYLRDSTSGALTLIAAQPGAAFFAELSNLGNQNLFGGTADWSHLVFQAKAALLPGAVEGQWNVYEYSEGQLRLVAAEALSPINGGLTMARPNVVSRDGSRIFFVSGEALYLQEDEATAVPVSASQRAENLGEPKPAKFLGASADGSVVYFLCDEDLTEASDTHGFNSLYRYEVDTGVLTDLTIDHLSPQGASVRAALGISEDGSYVYFAAHGKLTADSEEAIEQASNLYVWHEGDGIRFIGSTSPETGSTEFSGPVQKMVSPNGKFLGMGSFTPFSPEDETSAACPTSGVELNPAGWCRDVYVYGYDSDQLTCASCKGPGAGFTELGGQEYHSSTALHFARSVLDDGTVFFDSPNRLVNRDGNGVGDAYEWKDGVARLVSTGSGEVAANFADASPDGSDVFFRTSESLVAQDIDQSVDLYDARRGGGLAAQYVAPGGSATCEGDGCRGSAPVAPLASAPGSAALIGKGNQAGRAARRCADLSAGSRRAEQRASRFEAQARAASGEEARRLRQKAGREAKKAKQLGKKAHNCGGLSK